MGTAVDPLGVILAPVVLDAGHAVAVPTGDGDWIIGEVQAYRAVELLLCPQLTTHPDTVERKNKQVDEENKKMEGQTWVI